MSQESGLWLDLLDQLEIRAKAEISYINGASAYLAFFTSNSPGGPWTQVGTTTFSTPGRTVLVLSRRSDEESFKVERYVKWAMAGSGVWEICFRLCVEP